jgi:hypothetical protein
MPKRLQPTGKTNLESLAPTQVRIASIIEIGKKYPGGLAEVGIACESCERCEGCQSCQTCEGCQSCQTGIIAFLDKEIGVANLSAEPLQVARNVIYELIQERAGVTRKTSKPATRKRSSGRS